MKTLMFVMGLLILAHGVSVHAYHEQRELNLDAVGVETMEIMCGSGDLVVEGGPMENIRVTANIEIRGMNASKSKAYIRDHVELWLRKDGAKALLKSDPSKGYRRGGKADIHLIVHMPARLYLDVKDSSGDIEIFSVQGNLSLDDGSGGIRIHDMGGDLDIHDSSGEITVENVRGNALLKDGSGEIRVEDLQGNAMIHDGSGNISVYRTGGNLTIEDGSGSIRVRQVQGSVVVDDGSGDIDIQDVENGVVIQNDGSGSRRISNVRGNIVMH